MKYNVKISKKGSITIPAALRKTLALKPGRRVRQFVEKDKLVFDFGKETEALEQQGMRSKNND